VTWLARLPLWLKVAVPSVIVAVILCNLIGQSDNPPNPYADSLASTREAYAADTTRLLKYVAVLKADNDIAQDSIRVEQRRRKVAVGIADSLKWVTSKARADVVVADASGDSAAMIRARDAVIARQATELVTAEKDRDDSQAAFDRLTVDFRKAVRRADSAEAGWARTRVRLGIVDSALAIEKRRTSCYWNLVLKRVECPSRGAVAVFAAVGAVLVYSQTQKGK